MPLLLEESLEETELLGEGAQLVGSHLALHFLTRIFPTERMPPGLVIMLAHLAVPWFSPSQGMATLACGGSGILVQVLSLQPPV